MQATEKQLIEQEIIEDQIKRIEYITNWEFEYIDKFQKNPTAEELHNFIFEHKGIRVNKNHVKYTLEITI